MVTGRLVSGRNALPPARWCPKAWKDPEITATPTTLSLEILSRFGLWRCCFPLLP